MMTRMLSPRFMRDHRWTSRHMSDYLDDELDRRGRARVDRHVGLCPSCHKLLASLRKTLQSLHGLGRQPLRAEPIADSVIKRLYDSP